MAAQHEVDAGLREQARRRRAASPAALRLHGGIGAPVAEQRGDADAERVGGVARIERDGLERGAVEAGVGHQRRDQGERLGLSARPAVERVTQPPPESVGRRAGEPRMAAT